jgi:hypothetical protein
MPCHVVSLAFVFAMMVVPFDSSFYCAFLSLYFNGLVFFPLF